jgi:hypothetical protein
MKKTLVLGALAVLAAGAFLATPASAHDACDDSYGYSRASYGYSSGYYGSGYYGGGYGGGYYGGRSYSGYGGSRHDDAHGYLDSRHERWHDNHPYASGYQHYREHKRLAKDHDVYHHREYDEHAPNHARWYYGDDRDY